jgi:hypothetical protein
MLLYLLVCGWARESEKEKKAIEKNKAKHIHDML